MLRESNIIKQRIKQISKEDGVFPALKNIFSFYIIFRGGPGALLCVSSCAEQEVFAAGSYSCTVFVFDSRSGHKPIVEYHPHSRAVLKLAMNSSYILSASEDKKVTIWDQRARQMLRCVNISKNAFPMCMNMHRDWVYVGDSAAELHVLNPKNDFAIVKSYVTGHKKGITGVHQTRGCLITSSTDGTVRISSPTDPPKCLTTLTFRFGEVASVRISYIVIISLSQYLLLYYVYIDIM